MDIAVSAGLLGSQWAAAEKPDSAFAEAGWANPAVRRAGALVDTLHVLGARRISMVAPNLAALDGPTCVPTEAEGIDVEDCRGRPTSWIIQPVPSGSAKEQNEL